MITIKRFKKLTVIKYEKVKDAEYLQKIFNFDNILKNKIIFLLKNLKVNKSIGKKPLAFKFLQQVFSLFGLNYKSKYDNKILLSRLNNSNLFETKKSNKLKYLNLVLKNFYKPNFYR